MQNILFVCSRNQWRSPTAEAIFKNSAEINVRSAGTSSKAKRTVTHLDIQWADQILVMENKHRSRLKADFSRLLQFKPVHVLGIPDDYQFMDPELVETLKALVPDVLAG